MIFSIKILFSVENWYVHCVIYILNITGSAHYIVQCFSDIRGTSNYEKIF